MMEIKDEEQAEAEIYTKFRDLPVEDRYASIMRALEVKLSAPARDWQVGFAQRYTAAIKDNVSRRFLVVMPPGAGKTWTAWFAMLMETLGRPVNRNKVLYAVPLVALGEQKVAEIDELFKSVQLQLAIATGTRTVNAKEVVGMNPSRSLINTRTAVCTFEHCLIYLLGLYEKHAISPTQEGMLIDTLKLVVIDEAHEIGAEGRGFVVDRICAICSALGIPFLMLTGTLSRDSAYSIVNKLGIPEDGLIYGADQFRPFKASVVIEKEPVFRQLLTSLVHTALERAYEHPGVDSARQQQGGLLVFVTTRADTEKYAALALAIAFDAKLIPNVRTYQYGEHVSKGNERYKGPEKFVNKQTEIIAFLGKNMDLITKEACEFIRTLSMQRLAQMEWSTGIAYNCTDIGDDYEQLVKDHAQRPPVMTHIKVFVATNTLAVGVNLSAIDDVAIASLMRVRTPVSGDTIQQEIGRAARWRNATVLVNDDGNADRQLKSFDIPQRDATALLPSFLLQLATRFPEAIRQFDSVAGILSHMYWGIPEPNQAIEDAVMANQDILGLQDTGESLLLVSHLELEPQEAQMMTPQTLHAYRAVLGIMNDEETLQQPWSLFWPAFLTGLIQDARFPTAERITVKHYEMFATESNLNHLFSASVRHDDFLELYPSLYDLNLASGEYIINDVGNPKNSTFTVSERHSNLGKLDFFIKALYAGSYTNNRLDVNPVGRLLFRNFERFAATRNIERGDKDALFIATLGLVGETQTRDVDAKRRYAKAMMVGMYGSLALMGYPNEWNARFTVPVSELVLLLQGTLKTMNAYLLSLINMQYSGLSLEEVTRIKNFQERAWRKIQEVGLYAYLTQSKDEDFSWFRGYIMSHKVLSTIVGDRSVTTAEQAAVRIYSRFLPTLLDNTRAVLEQANNYYDKFNKWWTHIATNVNGQIEYDAQNQFGVFYPTAIGFWAASQLQRMPRTIIEVVSNVYREIHSVQPKNPGDLGYLQAYINDPEATPDEQDVVETVETGIGGTEWRVLAKAIIVSTRANKVYQGKARLSSSEPVEMQLRLTAVRSREIMRPYQVPTPDLRDVERMQKIMARYVPIDTERRTRQEHGSSLMLGRNRRTNRSMTRKYDDAL